MRFRTFALTTAFLTSLPLVFFAAGQDQKSSLPDGPGKDSVQKICTNCHDLDTATGTRRTALGWQRMVEDMVSRGAEASDDEMQAIVTYLTTFYGKVNVNSATAAELEKGLELPAKEAQAIFDYRQKNGKIADFEQLKKIPGVDADKIQAKRGMIAFTQ